MKQLTFSPSGISLELPDEVLTLVKKFSSDMMDEGELFYLLGGLALSPWTKKEIVVEIGTYIGSTAALLAITLRLLGREGCPILSIDPFDRIEQEELNAQGCFPKYLENIKHYGVEDICLPLIALSEQAAPVVPDRVGFLIVDGSHLYEGAKKDLELYAPKVVPGGVIFMDDYGQAYPGVQRAVDEYFTPDSPWSPVHKSYFVIFQRKM
jgi:predicted O-methyltransferase YrrM